MGCSWLTVDYLSRFYACVQVIEIAVVCAGYNSTRTAQTLLKSLLFYRTSPLHLHLLVDTPAQLILTTLFDTWDVANCKCMLESKEEEIFVGFPR